MKPAVDRELCIGCGLCEETCPEVFRLGEDGIAYVLDHDPAHESWGEIEECVEICPVVAIVLRED